MALKPEREVEVMGELVGALAIVLFLLISIRFLFSAGRNLQRANDSMAWPETTAQIASCSEVKSRRSGGSGSYDFTYFVNFEYRYAVDDVDYSGKGSSSGGTRKGAERDRSRYQSRPAITVYYNPSDPSQSVLKRGATFADYFSIALFAMVVIALALVLLNRAWPA